MELSGISALGLAAYQDNLEEFERLVNGETDLNAVVSEKDRETPFEIAVCCKRKRVAKYIASHPTFNPNLKTIDGFTPLMLTILAEEQTLAQTLAGRGDIDMTIKDNFGNDYATCLQDISKEISWLSTSILPT